MTLKANSNLQSSLPLSAAGRSNIRSVHASQIRSRCSFHHLDAVSAALLFGLPCKESLVLSATAFPLETPSPEFLHPNSFLAGMHTLQEQKFTLAVTEEEEDEDDEDEDDDDLDEDDDDLAEDEDEDDDLDEDDDEPEYDDEDDDLVDDEYDEDDE
jgi:hypothetical protein